MSIVRWNAAGYTIQSTGYGEAEVFLILNKTGHLVQEMQTLEGAEAYASLLASGHYEEVPMG